MTHQTFVRSLLPHLFYLLGSQQRADAVEWSQGFNSSFNAFLALHRGSVYTLQIISSHLSIGEHYPVKKHFVGLRSDVLIGSEKVAAPILSFQDWSVWLGKKKMFLWESDESSTMKKWRAPLLGQLPTAETGYDTLNLTVECMTMVVRVFLCSLCVFLSKDTFFPTLMVRNKAALTLQKLATPLFEYLRI